MRDTLVDIHEKLRNGSYQNEEHVRLSLVARILQELDWDIWNPREVNAEFVAAELDKTLPCLAESMRRIHSAITRNEKTSWRTARDEP